MKAVLISPGFGAGWSSWEGGDDERRAFLLSHNGLISALLAGEDLGLSERYVSPDDFQNGDEFDAVGYARAHVREGSPLDRFLLDWVERFGPSDLPYLGGARDLQVQLVDDHAVFRIHEYDGSESVELRDELSWFHADQL